MSLRYFYHVTYSLLDLEFSIGVLRAKAETYQYLNQPYFKNVYQYTWQQHICMRCFEQNLLSILLMKGLDNTTLLGGSLDLPVFLNLELSELFLVSSNLFRKQYFNLLYLYKFRSNLCFPCIFHLYQVWYISLSEVQDLKIL
mgnify:CR=1 FL=1